jgi:hypothetical protein
MYNVASEQCGDLAHPSESGCYCVDLTLIEAALVWRIFGREMVAVVRVIPNHTSYMVRGLVRPLIVSCEVH